MPDKNKYSIDTLSENEKRFFTDISQILLDGRNKAIVTINSAMVETYWNMGRRIVEQEQQGKERANYGDQLLVNLSRYLGGILVRVFPLPI